VRPNSNAQITSSARCWIDRHVETKRLGRSEIGHQLILGRRLPFALIGLDADGARQRINDQWTAQQAKQASAGTGRHHLYRDWRVILPL
jgi:hypothetical protein